MKFTIDLKEVGMEDVEENINNTLWLIHLKKATLLEH